MGDYQRTTRECNFAQLRPELAAAMRQHARQVELGDVERDALICCETTNEKKKSGFLSKLTGDPDKAHYTGTVVTPRLLIWATGGAKRGAVVLSARLTDMEVQDYAATPYVKLVEDTGLEVTSVMTGGLERVQAFIGLGREPAAQQLRQVLREALQRASS